LVTVGHSHHQIQQHQRGSQQEGAEQHAKQATSETKTNMSSTRTKSHQSIIFDEESEPGNSVESSEHYSV